MFVERVAIRSPFFMPETQKKCKKSARYLLFCIANSKLFRIFVIANKVINLNTLRYEY